MTKRTMKKFKDSFKYGGIDVNTINSTDELVPTESIDVTLPDEDKRALSIALNEAMPALLIGEAGTGKTSVIKQLAHLRKQPYVRVNMTGFTTPDELIGSKSVKDGKTYFENGIISDAMQRGALLVLDEINATSPDCLFILHGLLDEDKRITLPNGEVIKPHPDFRVFATCNPDYEGTKSMNKAFLDRFPIVITVDVLTPAKEKQLLVDRTGIPEKLSEQLVTIATMARKDYTEQKIMSYVSTRGLINIGKLIQAGLEPKTAYQTTIVKKTSNKEEQKILMDFFLAVMKMASGTAEQQLDMPIVTTQRELKLLEANATNRQKQAEEYYSKAKEATAQLQVIKVELEKTTAITNEQKTLTQLQQQELEDLRKAIQGYKKLEAIIQTASKQYNTPEKTAKALEEAGKIATIPTTTATDEPI
jgi:MoxR-like ATPase